MSFWPLAALLLQTVPSRGSAQPPVPPLPSPVRPTPYTVLAAEHARGAELRVLDDALAGSDTVVQRLAVRALGRLEDPRLAARIAPMLRAAAASVRREAANAAAQLNAPELFRTHAPFPFAQEPDVNVRAMLYEAFGRRAPGDSASELALLPGLSDDAPVVRRGAARGLEAFARRTARQYKLSRKALDAMTATVARDGDRDVRLPLLLALNSTGHRDSATVRVALADADAQVRRAGVMLGRVWVSDTSAMVRWQALRVAGDCERAAAHVRDASEHVRLLAVDLLGEKRCAPSTLLPLTRANVPWRLRAHAVYALAFASPADAAQPVRVLARDPVWQARVWAAQAAKQLRDSSTLQRLAYDVEPNVRVAAITSPHEAAAALSVNHAGLLLHAATVLREYKGTTDTIARYLPALMRAFERISASQPVTWRDARVALLETITPMLADGPYSNGGWLARWSTDADPAVAQVVLNRLPHLRDGDGKPPRALPYVPPPLPSESALRALEGATALVRIRGLGTMEIDFLEEDAPLAVHTFVTLAQRGAFTGKTLHRIVPNFVVQGGSPGADEYDPATSFFMRDEVGASNARGTFGVSTRGRDTGDGQLYVNLVDNLRLDHDYTVFARTVRGLDVLDRIQEGDVIESIIIRRKTR